MICKYVGKAIFRGKPDKIFPFMETGGVYDIVVNESQQGQFNIVHPFYCPYSSWGTFLKNWELSESTTESKPKKDMYGEDSPMIADLSKMRSTLLKWITIDSTDKDYPYKLDEKAFFHMTRDAIGLAPRLLSNHIKPIKTKKKLRK